MCATPTITPNIAPTGTKEATPSLNGWSCPLPIRDHPNIIMGHGGGGKLSADLVQHLFLPAFQNETLAHLADSAVLNVPMLDVGGADVAGRDVAGARLAFSTDSFVVQPLFFPGGNIGDLAVNGTVNDLAMNGARPLFLSCAFILEEGMPLAQLYEIAQSMAAAARTAGVTLVTGDTKVVEKGHGDGVYINTSGIGLIPAQVKLGPQLARPGDVVLVSGEIGLHGIAVMSVRAGITFESAVESDCAPLHDLVAALFATTSELHVLRDPTRGGVASALNEIAKASQVGIQLDEPKLPVPQAVAAACELLGLDPLYVANEGKLIAIAPAAVADELLATMRSHPLGRRAAIIGEVVDRHPGMVVARTAIGGKRVVDMMVGEQLPRIC